MTAAAAPKFLTQAEFARHRKVSRKAVTGWKAKDLLVFAEDGRIDVEATEWKLDERPAKYRGGVTHRPVRAVTGNSSTPEPKAPAAAKLSPRPAPEAEGDEGEDPSDPTNLPLPDAIRRKENFLGLQRKQEVERNEKKLVDREAAEKLFFDTARDFRDAWLAWPARIAVGMADELKVDPRALTTILNAHVKQHLSIEIGSGKLSAFNRLKLSYSSPVHNYQIQEGDAWDDVAAQAEAGETLEADFSRPWVQWHEQLRRLAKIKMGKDNPEFRITGLVTKLSGAAALFEESITLSLPLYGIEAIFLVQRAVASPANETCTFDLTSIAREIYDFDPVTEEGSGPPLPGEQAASTPPAPPESLVVLVDRRVVSGDLSAVFVRALATEPARADLTLIGRYRRVGDSDWLDMAPEGDNRGSVVSSVLADGENYEVQGAIATYGRAQQSDWIEASGSPFTAVADPSLPGSPTGFNVTGATGSASLSWTTPNSSNFKATRIYRGTTSTFSAATLIQTRQGSALQAMSYVDGSRPAGVYYYWVRAVNASGLGDATSTSGPVNVTVT